MFYNRQQGFVVLFIGELTEYEVSFIVLGKLWGNCPLPLSDRGF